MWKIEIFEWGVKVGEITTKYKSMWKLMINEEHSLFRSARYTKIK